MSSLPGPRNRWRRLQPKGASKIDDAFRPFQWADDTVYYLKDVNSENYYLWNELRRKVMKRTINADFVSPYDSREKPSLGSLGNMSLVAMLEWRFFDAPHPSPQRGVKTGPRSQFNKAQDL